MSKHPRGIGSWEQWLALWDSATNFVELDGLLHCGFRIYPTPPLDQEVARVRFYLGIANGHQGESWTFSREGASNSEEAIARLALAEKAFAELSKHFFSEPTDLLAREPYVLSKLIEFFHIDARQVCPNLRRYMGEKPSVHERNARRFVLELCKLGWTDNAFIGLRRHFIEMLLGTGQLNLLLDHEKYPLDTDSWHKLEELATARRYFRTSPPVAGCATWRRPVSVEEAAKAGSDAARVLILLRAFRTEAAKV